MANCKASSHPGTFRLQDTRGLLCATGNALALTAFAAILLSSGAARASTLNCGDTLTAGNYVLETDLTCPSNSGNGVGLYVTSGAVLDLGGHTIRMTIGGSGTGLVLSGTGATVFNGTVTNSDIGISIAGGYHHLHDLHVNGNNTGLALQNTDHDAISDSEINGNAVFGLFVKNSNHNRFERLVVNDTNGIGPSAGFRVIDSNDNTFMRNQVERSLCTGISLENSSRNIVCFNTVQDSNSFFPKPSPAVNILVYGTSSENMLCLNDVSATTPGTADGINIGCKDKCVCGFQDPTTGAERNLVIGNTSNDNDRYGVAQATGNDGNRYLHNEATGNGVANFAIDP